MEPTITDNRATEWFGTWDFSEGETRRCRIGPFTLWLTYGEGEWRFCGHMAPDRLDGSLEPLTPGEIPRDEDCTIGPLRMGFGSAEGRVTLAPVCADRPLVVRPTHPFLLPAGQELTFFVSSILWLRVEVEAARSVLADVPLFRPSDTWFGPSPREGELCYDLTTSARLRRENLPDLPHRALSALTLRNGSPSDIVLEKLLLPAPNMSVFANDQGNLWTESARMSLTSREGQAGVKLEPRPHPSAGSVRLVSGPREKGTRGFLTRALGGLLGGGSGEG